ncbi:type VI secretion system baseplate subunit TssK [Pseudomonas sp. FEN]|uniref:type VI secretion system baseplate subunit TssK n=1 Tax=Pseudomonas sp. FEN TaxID=2767468 RepID=UPI001749FE19|nr:type VI secretion system baseplate subunit TssK [Pseudomonas sp. FEN]
MSSDDRVVWAEGMFLLPQHFQQQERHHRARLAQVLRALQPHGWGFAALKIDAAQLALGTLALSACEGIMPDGSPFALTDEELARLRYPVADSERDVQLVLALAVKRPGATDTEASPGADSLARYRISEIMVADVHAEGAEPACLQVSRLHLKLAREEQVAASHVFLRVARVVERTATGLVVLDRQQVAPLLAWRCSSVLARSVDELIARARQRGVALAEGLGQGGLGGLTEIQQYVMLQSVNRAESLLLHLASQPALHPELLYRELVRLAGELAIFCPDRKRPRAYPPYRHDRLGETFVPLLQDLLQALSAVTSADVVALTLKSGAFGFRFAQVPDINLYQSARFILAVRAQVPDEELRKSFPNRLKIGPAQRLHDLVNLQLSGLAIEVLPAAPRELPYYPGFSYFQVSSDHSLWADLVDSSGFGLHVAGSFPGLQLAFWAIRAS